MAQDNNYSGPAKSFVTSFWQMSKMTNELAENGMLNVASRIDNMDETIDIIKAKDPSSNTATMSSEVKKLRELLQSRAGTYGKEILQIRMEKSKERQVYDNNAKSDRSTQSKIASLHTFLFYGNMDDHIT